MGYYTQYTIEATPDSEELQTAIKTLNGGTENYRTFRTENEFADPVVFESHEPVKWYAREQEMRGLSKRFPEVLFKVHGEGEESGDIWEAYFKNGKMQLCKAQIVIEKYDPKKLK